MHYLVEKHQLNSTIRCKHSKVKETETITQEEYIQDWQQKVTQVKKLTYFHSIKSDYKLAPHLSIIKGYGQRKLSEWTQSVCGDGPTQAELESPRAQTVFSLHRRTHRGRAALPYGVQQI